jgi:hypothetical protein
MRARKDTPVAITATAHKLARLIYRTLKYGQDYVNVGSDIYEAKYKDAIVKLANAFGVNSSGATTSLAQ